MPHTYFTYNDLATAIRKHTRIAEKTTASGKMIFTEYGARLLGLFPDAAMPNVLWVHGDVDACMGAKSWYVGGERLWISPERDYYYENPRDFESHHVCPEMDPGEYRMTGDLVFENTFTLFNYMKNEAYERCYAKRVFEPMSDPYGTGLAYAGVRITDTMQITAPNATMCVWSLAMLYTCGVDAPGTALFPIKKGAEFLGYFGPIPKTRASVMKDGYVRFKIDAAQVHKLALRPEDIVFDNLCKALYVAPYPGGRKWFCVMKRTNDMPRSQDGCVDPAKADPDGQRGTTQSYNSGPEPTKKIFFGEIELQLNKGVATGAVTTSTATHELLSYAGTKDEILNLAKTALGIATAPAVF